MDDYGKYIITNHLHWIDNGITQQQICNSCKEVKEQNVFFYAHMLQIQQNLKYDLDYKEVINASEYEKIKFLWLSLCTIPINLEFLKHCLNLEEINLSCFDEVNLDCLKHNLKLNDIIANDNKLNNIDALHNHFDLEYINLENNNCISLKPIAHLKKIKDLKVGLIDDEKHALNILKNNLVCAMVYIIEVVETGFEDLTIPYYYWQITKEDNQIKFLLAGVKNTSSFPELINFPENIINDKTLFETVLELAKAEIENRLKIILNKSIIFNFENYDYCCRSYHHTYTHIL